ncbi:MAG: aspartate-semialdehyde dehydrogenase [Methanosaeta sp. SDB]|nr:MAG: aspartate-semialdehyde dehydrogenase [Methanosaeta sp. SDB]
MSKNVNVAVVGACGMVGGEMIRTLERRNFPVKSLRPLDVAANEGTKVVFRGEDVEVLEAKKDNFADIDVAIFSAGAGASLKLAPEAVEMGAVVVDNSSAWRMNDQCPLVVPEVNPEDLRKHKGIIANPNCSTIQMVVVLKVLHEAARVKRVVVSTYQAVSGSGVKAFQGLKDEAAEYLKAMKPVTPRAYGKQIAFNCLPQIDVFQEGGYTKEEYKMVNETRKIMGDDSIRVTATCVRVPVWYGHSESVNVETEKKLSADEARELLKNAESIIVMDDPGTETYPVPLDSNERDETMVGRIREDYSIEKGLNLWIVSNNIRKGAALNAVQIAEKLLEMGLV